MEIFPSYLHGQSVQGGGQRTCIFFQKKNLSKRGSGGFQLTDQFSKVAFYGFPYFLLKLAESVDLTVYTPACLPRPEDDFYRQTGNVYGELEKLVKNSTSRFVWARQGKGKSVGKVKDLVKFSSFEDRRWVQDPLGTFGP